MKKKESRYWYLDAIRFIAIILVLFIHVTSKDFHRVDIESFHWQWLNFVNGSARIAVPLFFMVSGALFLKPEKEIAVGDIYSKYIWRIARAFLLWSAIYVLYDILMAPPVDPLAGAEIKNQTFHYITGNFHLWFIYRLAELYVILPLIKPLINNNSTMRYFLVLSYIVGFIVPTIQQFPISSTETIMDSGLNFDITLGYASYMMMGYYISQADWSLKKRRWLYIAGMMGLLVTVIGTSVMSLRQGERFTLFYEYLTPNVHIAAIAFFIFMKEHFDKKQLTMNTKKILAIMAKYTFGIYLSHVLVRDILWRLGWNTTLLNPVLSVPLSVIVIFILSFGLVRLLSKVPIIRKCL